MSKQAKPEPMESVTLLPKTFTTGYRRDLDLARKLIKKRRGGFEVRTKVVS